MQFSKQSLLFACKACKKEQCRKRLISDENFLDLIQSLEAFFLETLTFSESIDLLTTEILTRRMCFESDVRR